MTDKKYQAARDRAVMEWAAEYFAKELTEAKDAIKLLRDALGFYAEKSVWGNGCAAIDPCDTYTCELNVLRGGKRSLQALEQTKKWSE